MSPIVKFALDLAAFIFIAAVSLTVIALAFAFFERF